MKGLVFANNVKLVGEEMMCKGERMIDYYLLISENTRVFAFRRKYSNGTYDLCKGGIRVNDLLTHRSKNRGVMNLVKYMKVMMPYFAEYYEISVAV